MDDILKRLLETGGLGIFIWFLIRSLKEQISGLQRTLEIQNKTLQAMEKRAEEAEKIGALYRKLLEDLPQDLDRYRDTLRRLKDEIIRELEEANRRKDETLSARTQSELDEIVRAEEELEKLSSRVVGAVSASYDDMAKKLSILDLLQPGTPIGDFLLEIHLRWKRQRGGDTGRSHLPSVAQRWIE